MKHPDDSQLAVDFVKKHADRFIKNGVPIDQAIVDATNLWENSLIRIQGIKIYNDNLLKAGKPTLRVTIADLVNASIRRKS